MSELLELPRLPPHVLMPTVGALRVSRATGNNQGRLGWTPADCATCGGTGQFKAWLRAPGDTDHIGEFRCPCREQLRLRRWFAIHGIHDSYQDFSLGHALSWAPEDPRRKFLGEQIVRIEEGKLPRSSVLFSPQPGTGKTLISVLITKALLWQGVDAFLLNSASISGVVSNWGGTDGREVRKWWTNRVRSAEVLVIDDLGREKEGEWERERIADLIRHRHSLDLPWVITANKDPRRPGTASQPNYFERRYGEETRDLVVRHSDLINFSSAPEFDHRSVHSLGEELGIARPSIFLGVGR